MSIFNILPLSHFGSPTGQNLHRFKFCSFPTPPQHVDGKNRAHVYRSLLKFMPLYLYAFLYSILIQTTGDFTNSVTKYFLGDSITAHNYFSNFIHEG